MIEWIQSTYPLQIDWIKALNGHSIAWLNAVFVFLNNLDTLPFYAVVAMVVWHGYRQKRGVELLFLVLINSFVCQTLKSYFHLPRPYLIDPSASLIQVQFDGFPSGAAMASMLWGCYLIYHWKRKLAWVVALLYILLAGFTRIYIGVHFITDVLMGWFVGYTIFFLYTQLHTSILGCISNMQPRKKYATVAIFMLWPFFLFFQSLVLLSIAPLLSLSLGMVITQKCNYKKMEDPTCGKEGLIRAIVTILQTCLIALPGHWILVGHGKGFIWALALLMITGILWLTIVTPWINARISRWILAK